MPHRHLTRMLDDQLTALRHSHRHAAVMEATAAHHHLVVVLPAVDSEGARTAHLHQEEVTAAMVEVAATVVMEVKDNLNVSLGAQWDMETNILFSSICKRLVQRLSVEQSADMVSWGL
jgi:hypothetical protein